MLAEFLDRMSVTQEAWDIDLVRRLAAKFRVTPLAMATRLRIAGAMTWNAYRQWKAKWAEYLASLTPRKGGFASPVDKTLTRAGRPLAQLVVEAMDLNRITAVQACQHLNLRFEHFDELRTELRLGSRRAPSADDDDCVFSREPRLASAIPGDALRAFELGCQFMNRKESRSASREVQGLLGQCAMATVAILATLATLNL
jgi:hypothetical protein